MYAKYINEYVIEEAPYEKNGVVNYNLDTNSQALLQDGYLPVIIEPSESTENNLLKYRLENNTIIGYYVYVEPEEQEPNEAEAV